MAEFLPTPGMCDARVRQKDVAQIVECLPTRYKDLGTQPKYTQHGGIYFLIPVVRKGRQKDQL